MLTLDPNTLTAAARPLTLLQTGAKIVFADGTYLAGDTSTNYLEVGTESGSAGVWSLDEQGIINALADLKQMRAAIMAE